MSETSPKIIIIGPSTPPPGGVAAIVEQFSGQHFKEVFHVKLINTVPKVNLLRFKICKPFNWTRYTIQVIIHALFFRHHSVILQMSNDKICIREFFFAWVYKTFTHSKIFIHFHGNITNRKKAYPFIPEVIEKKSIQKKLNFGFSQADAVLFLTENIQKSFTPYLSKSIIEKSVVINNFTTVEFFQNKKKHSGFNILYVGRFSQEKGLHDLLTSFKFLSEKYPDIRCHLCGELSTDKELKQALQNEENAKDSKVINHGIVYGIKKAEVFSIADVLVLPSYREIFPVVILEAYAQGVPVIAANTGVVNEILQDNVNGFLIESGDIKTLTEKIEYLYNNSELCKQIGTINKQVATEKYDVKIAIEKIRKILNRGNS